MGLLKCMMCTLRALRQLCDGLPVFMPPRTAACHVCGLILLATSPGAIYVSSYHYIYVHMRPHTADCEVWQQRCASYARVASICLLSLYYYMCPRTTIYICPRTTIYVSSCVEYMPPVLVLLYMCPQTNKCVLILLHMCPQICLLSSYYYTRALVPLYMCPQQSQPKNVSSCSYCYIAHTAI